MRYGLLLAATLTLLAPHAARGEEEAVFGNVRLGCGSCHTDRVIVSAGEGRIDFRSLRPERAGEERVCRSCHNGVVRDSRALIWERFQHPTGVRAKARLKVKGLPLHEGEVFCGTCHTPHVRGAGIGPFMRFAGDDPLLCQRCHAGRGEGLERGQHPLARVDTPFPSRLLAAGGITGPRGMIACASCHRTHGAASPFLLVLNPWGEDGLCQTCHGVDPGRKASDGAARSHPVNRGVSVPGAESWSRGAVVVSPDGRVDCWSCHRSHGSDGEEHLLVREIAGGMGCLRCHPERGAEGLRQGNHPVREAKEGTDRPATCRSCHRAHNADRRSSSLLLRAAGSDEACSGCHADRFAEGVNHPVKKETRVDCFTCHRVHGSLPGTPSLAAEERRLCLGCHPGQAQFGPGARPGTHPILVVPGRDETLAEEVGPLLGPRGEVICTTCHLVHGGDGRGPGSRRIACADCHAGKDRENGHASRAAGKAGIEEGRETCFVCHRAHGWGVTMAEEGEDLPTGVCRSCHREEGSAPAAREVSHPVGVKPAGARALGISLPLFLPDGRRFKRGNVSCATCHDAHGSPGSRGWYPREPGLEGARLCLECHPDKETVTRTRHDLTVGSPKEMNLKGIEASSGGVCSSCHLAHGGFERTAWARLVDGQGRTGSQLCRSCHHQGLIGGDKVPGNYTHPAGIVAGWSPEGIPAGPDQEPLTCLTCHEPHRWDPSDPAERGEESDEGGERNSFLRWPNDAGSSLCLRCHAEKGVVAGTQHDPRGEARSVKACAPLFGGSLCGGCHLVHRGEGPMGWPGTVEQAGISGEGLCRECHREEGCAPDRSSGIGSHPVGLAVPGYRGEALPLHDGAGRRTARGHITCATCHDVHGAGEEGSLRLTADGHAPLCGECHEKQGLVAGTEHDLRMSAPDSAGVSGRTAGRSGICAGCHVVHGGTYGFFLWDRPLGEGTDFMTSFCTGCHRAEGIGREPAAYYRHFQYGRAGALGDVRRVFTLRRGRRARRDDSLALYSGEGEPSEHGYITCVTCHDPHRWDPGTELPGPGVMGDGGPGDSFLRLKGSFAILNTFCAECHGDESVELFNGFHSRPEREP